MNDSDDKKISDTAKPVTAPVGKAAAKPTVKPKTAAKPAAKKPAAAKKTIAKKAAPKKATTKKPVTKAASKRKTKLEKMVTDSGLEQVVDLNNANSPTHPDRIWPD